MKTIYVIKLNNKKYLNRLLKYGIKFYKIKYQNDICFLYVNFIDYCKLIKYKDIYGLSLYKINGFSNIKNIIKSNIIFIISVFIGILFLYLLSHIIFDIKIMSDNKDLIKIINNELNAANLKKYRFIKTFDEKEKLKDIILSEYKDKIEWIEIDRIGTKYYIRVLERIINQENKDIYQNIVARKNAVIKEIKASSGEIIKKINDYVNKGDVVISGLITKNDEVKNIVVAKGSVYGETWYKVKVILPRTYKDIKYTGNSYHKLSLNILNKKIVLFDSKKYNDYKYQDDPIISNKLLPFSLSYTNVLEKKEDIYFYTYQDAIEKGLTLAKEKLLNDLKEDSKILYQKKLKLYEENSTIVVEVFFKVYENITDYKTIKITGGDNGYNN